MSVQHFDTLPQSKRLSGTDAGIWRRIADMPDIDGACPLSLSQRVARKYFKGLVRRRKHLERVFPLGVRRRRHDVIFLLRKRHPDRIKKAGGVAVLAQKKRNNQIKDHHPARQLHVQFVKGVGHLDFSSVVRLVRAGQRRLSLRGWRGASAPSFSSPEEGSA